MEQKFILGLAVFASVMLCGINSSPLRRRLLLSVQGDISLSTVCQESHFRRHFQSLARKYSKLQSSTNISMTFVEREETGQYNFHIAFSTNKTLSSLMADVDLVLGTMICTGRSLGLRDPPLYRGPLLQDLKNRLHNADDQFDSLFLQALEQLELTKTEILDAAAWETRAAPGDESCGHELSRVLPRAHVTFTTAHTLLHMAAHYCHSHRF